MRRTVIIHRVTSSSTAASCRRRPEQTYSTKDLIFPARTENHGSDVFLPLSYAILITMSCCE